MNGPFSTTATEISLDYRGHVEVCPLNSDLALIGLQPDLSGVYVQDTTGNYGVIYYYETILGDANALYLYLQDYALETTEEAATIETTTSSDYTITRKPFQMIDEVFLVGQLLNPLAGGFQQYTCVYNRSTVDLHINEAVYAGSELKIKWKTQIPSLI